MKRYDLKRDMNKPVDVLLDEVEGGRFYLCSEVDAALTAVREEVERLRGIELKLKAIEKKYTVAFTCGENEDGSTFEDVKIFPRT